MKFDFQPGFRCHELKRKQETQNFRRKQTETENKEEEKRGEKENRRGVNGSAR